MMCRQIQRYNTLTIIVLIIIAFGLNACNVPLDTEQISMTITPYSITEIIPSPTSVIHQEAFPTVRPTLSLDSNLAQLKANLLGEACSNPCWYGIEPSKTTADNVPILLNQLQEQGIIESFYLVNHPFTTSYDFKLTTNIEITGGVVIDEDINAVTRVDTDFFSAKFISLDDVIHAYGTPVLVAEGGGDTFDGLYLSYPEKEVFLWIRTDSFGEEMVSPEMTLVTLTYLSSYAYNHEIQNPDINWVSWDGYQTFDYYYEKFNQGEN